MDAVLMSSLATAGVLVVIAMLFLLQRRLAQSESAFRGLDRLLVSAAGLLIGLCGALIGGIPPLLVGPVAALGALFASLAGGAALLAGAPRYGAVVLAAIATGIGFVPLSTLVFDFWFDPFATGLGIIDFGGALPTLVGGGTAAIAILLLSRKLGTTGPMEDGAGWWGTLWPALALWAAWLAWLIGLELGVDPVTPLIVVNGLLMPLAGAVVCVVVERIRHVATTPSSLAGGVLAGLAAATPAVAYLEPLLAGITAIIAGAVCGLLPRGGRLAGIRLVVRNCTVGAAVSLILLGFFAKQTGFIYTGQPEVFFSQTLGTLIAAVLGFLAAALIWAVSAVIGGVRRSQS